MNRLCPTCGFAMRRSLIFALVLYLAIVSAAIAGDADGNRDPSLTRRASVSFELDVMPILTARGCNQGACHGKSRGQNGFQLSLLGFDADFDYAALTQEARGRRVFPASPENSLVLLKAIGQMPHGGGRRLQKGDGHYEVLLRWIAAGAPRTPPETPALERITVVP